MDSNNLLRSPKHQLIILMFLAFGLNFNTLFNDYAVDDVIVMTHNKYVEKGLSGIPELLSQNYFSGWDGNVAGELSGGRYRPFALVVFALEHQLFGVKPMVSHLINVLLLTLLTALLYILLQKYLFRYLHEYLAFITCLLFIVHPIHTEVIANVKGRDELIAFIFLTLSMLSLIKHSEKKSFYLFFIGLICFFIALLTRESALTFIVVFPLIMYFFFKHTLKEAAILSIPLIGVVIGYLTLRYLMVGIKTSASNDILFAPFLYASTSQAFATKIFIIGKNIYMLLLPYQLSSDYGYSQIPYIDLVSLKFILSLLFIIILLGIALYYFKKRAIISFNILYFFVTISLVSNILVDIGTPFSERLLFQPSLAFCILVAALYFYMKDKFKVPSNIVLIAVLILFTIKTYSRNIEWRNNDILYTADIISTPESLRINLYLTESYLAKANAEKLLEERKNYFKQTISYARQALKIVPKHINANKYLIDAYSGLLCCYPSIDLFMVDTNLNHNNRGSTDIIEIISNSFYKQGNGLFEQRKLEEAIFCYKKSIELNPKNVEAWYNLGGTYLTKKDTTNAKIAWEKVKSISPSHPLNEDDF